ncbi:MAG: hypothetical protein ACFFDN_26580 [Candidatus Hodarchaeota archaeon]
MVREINGISIHWNLPEEFRPPHYVLAPSAPKNHELDEQYLHRCFKCHKKIYFNHILSQNPTFSRSYIESLWKNPMVQFYCCLHFAEAKKIQKIENKKNRLLKKAERICTKFGYKLK